MVTIGGCINGAIGLIFALPQQPPFSKFAVSRIREPGNIANKKLRSHSPIHSHRTLWLLLPFASRSGNPIHFLFYSPNC
ncbi:hypothetical protein RIF29_10506 [Crotalaria pallida]|uniref:Uncharacterized protein n=1 Tax=Crotalaria pallida TaxID=3830 RepID=A0AAN9FZ01_CROPI